MDVLDHEVFELIASFLEIVDSMFGATERYGIPFVEPYGMRYTMFP